MRLMYDSITAADIPASAGMVAGYLDGLYAWSAADWMRWPGTTTKVGIAVSVTTNAGHVLDVETGDATPNQAVYWVLNRRAVGVDPSVYCSLSAWAGVRQAFTSRGIVEPHYWVAGYPGAGPTVPDGAVAHQYANENTSGGHYDLSVVLDYWPGVDPTPTIKETQPVFWFISKLNPDGTDPGTTRALLYPSGDVVPVPGANVSDVITANQVPCLSVPPAVWDAMVGLTAAKTAALASQINTAITGGVTPAQIAAGVQQALTGLTETFQAKP